MKKPIRTPLSGEQLADAKRLSAIYKERVKESRETPGSPTLTQTEVGEQCGWNSPQSTVSQYMNGKVALNLDALVKLARVLKFELKDVSPMLAEGIVHLGADQPKDDNEAVRATSTQSSVSSAPLPTGDDDLDGANGKYSFIPQYTAKAAAGAGYENQHVEVRSTLAFKRDWLRAKGLQPKNLLVIYASGESMWPTISDHDVLLVDTSQIEPVENGVFVLESGTQGATVKRLMPSFPNSWTLRSDNADKDEYPDQHYSQNDFNERRIIGRVIWRGGDL